MAFTSGINYVPTVR